MTVRWEPEKETYEEFKKRRSKSSGISGMGQKKREGTGKINNCLLYTSPSPRDLSTSRMPSSA